MRIAHIDTERTWRGGEQQATSLIQGLKKKGHYNLAVARKNSAFAVRLKKIGIDVFEINPWGEWDFIAAHRINRALKENHIDLIHAHTAHGAGLGIFAALGTSIPVIASRRVDFHISKNPFSQWKYNRCRKILAVSDGVKKVLLEDGIDEKKVSVVKSGLDFSRFENVSKVSKALMGAAEDELVIGQVAALADHKDQGTFIQAIHEVRKKIPKVCGVIIGEGDKRLELEKLINTLNLQHHFHLVGFKENPLDFLAAFDLFCLSSKLEGLGVSTLEAMALNVPVVATRTGGIPEYVIDGVTGFLSSPQNPDELAASLIRAINLKGKDEELIHNAYKIALDYDVKKTIERTEKEYEQVLTR